MANLSALRHFLRDTVNMESKEAAGYIRSIRNAGVNSEEKEAEMLKHLRGKYDAKGGEHWDTNISNEVYNALGAQPWRFNGQAVGTGLGERVHSAGELHNRIKFKSRRRIISDNWAADRTEVNRKLQAQQNSQEMQRQYSEQLGAVLSDPVTAAQKTAEAEAKAAEQARNNKLMQGLDETAGIGPNNVPTVQLAPPSPTSAAETSTAGSSTNGLIYGKGIGKDPAPDGATVSEAMARNAPKPQEITGGTVQGKEVSEAMRASATPKSGEPVSQNAGGSVETKGDFDNSSGAGRDTVEERARERLSDRDIKNSDKFHVEDKLDTYQGYKARAKELEKQLEKQDISKEEFNKKLGELNEQHGIGAGVDPEKFFLDQINGKATTWDWVRGNNVIEIGAGGALAAGAIASCFSNKGKMSNSELYGQNF